MKARSAFLVLGLVFSLSIFAEGEKFHAYNGAIWASGESLSCLDAKVTAYLKDAKTPYVSERTENFDGTKTIRVRGKKTYGLDAFATPIQAACGFEGVKIFAGGKLAIPGPSKIRYVSEELNPDCGYPAPRVEVGFVGFEEGRLPAGFTLASDFEILTTASTRARVLNMLEKNAEREQIFSVSGISKMPLFTRGKGKDVYFVTEDVGMAESFTLYRIHSDGGKIEKLSSVNVVPCGS